MYLLDTSFLVELVRQKERSWSFLEAHKDEAMYVSTICIAEIYEGIYREKRETISIKKEFFQDLLRAFEIVYFNTEQAEIAGKIRADLANKGTLIGDLDILIAAAAIVNNATLVTYNPKHFQRIRELRVHSLL